jgi:succinylglutamic semialdehyde dehydrogenase
LNPKPSHFINGRWMDGDGSAFTSIDPATQTQTWHGRAAATGRIDSAVWTARAAGLEWAATSIDHRQRAIQSIAEQYRQRKAALAEAIWRETGKPKWEALTEVDAMIAKVAITIEAYSRRTAESSAVSAGVTSATRYKPHGLVAVFGPFNMPGHLPNGHIIPALLAGNTIVFKPSEHTPLVGQAMAEAWEAAGLPPGVINVIQGGAETGRALSSHDGIDGVFFTGSAGVGCALGQVLAASDPRKILALEMGGNNPLIVHDAAGLDAAAYLTIQSAFITAGQRCTCARRLILPRGAWGDRFIDHLIEMTRQLRIGFPTDEPEPFIGTVISAQAADSLLAAQASLLAAGGRALLKLERSDRSPALLSPGIVDVTNRSVHEDIELFGPLLQIIRANDFDEAIAEANETRFGLAAGLISEDRALYERFYREIRAGVVNWNRPLTGASSQLPFGGIGLSGNHRPSGYFAVDYCSYPVATMESERVTMPEKTLPGIPLP